MGAHLFQSVPNADIILVSCEEHNDRFEFYVHKCILSAASPFFNDMFSLPQVPIGEQELPIIPVSESRSTLEILLQFVYPTEDPYVDTLDELVPVLNAAVKYDFTATIGVLGKVLVSPRFAEAEPTRVYAIASRFHLEEEAKIASRYTLNINVLDSPLSDDLKYITAHSYARLLSLHHQRVKAAIEMLKLPQDVKCMQCNGSSFSVYNVPKWWYEFERRAKEELSVRPTTNVIFSMEFLAQVSIASGCTRCAGSVLDSWKFLGQLKREIDELPSTI